MNLLLQMRQRLSQRCREFWRVEHHALEQSAVDLARQIADLPALLYRHPLRIPDRAARFIEEQRKVNALTSMPSVEALDVGRPTSIAESVRYGRCLRPPACAPCAV